MSEYESISVSVTSDVVSAPCGVEVQFSSDGTNWDIVRAYTFFALVTFTKTITVDAQYTRIRYTNGSSAQASFRLQTIANATKAGQDTAQLVVFPDGTADAFGKFRVAEPYNIVELTHTRATAPQEHTVLTGTGTATKATNGPYETLSVLTSGDTVIQQTRERGTYQPGKSLLILNTGVLNPTGANATGTTMRIGYFDASDGAFFQHTGNGGAGTVSVVLRTSLSGTPVDTAIAQSNWNIDSLDGTGTSGLVLDSTKTQIFLIDLSWLGVGTVYFGFLIDRALIYVHKFVNSNVNNLPYMYTASLPCRFEARSTVASAVGSVIHVCSAVISEGGFTPIGRRFAITRGDSTKTVANGVITPVIAIRLKSTGVSPKVNVLVQDVRELCTSTGNVSWSLWIFRDVTTITNVLTGSSFVSAGTDSAVEYDFSATAITTTTGTRLSSGFFSSSSDFVNIDLPVANNIKLTSNINEVSDLIVFTNLAIGQNETVTASMSWVEIF